MTKADVRALARDLGLADIAELPAQPCLASRVETGIAIDPDDLLRRASWNARSRGSHRRARRSAAGSPGAASRSRSARKQRRGRARSPIGRRTFVAADARVFAGAPALSPRRHVRPAMTTRMSRWIGIASSAPASPRRCSAPARARRRSRDCRRGGEGRRLLLTRLSASVFATAADSAGNPRL